MNMKNTVMKPAWAGTTLRLDPSRFPQQVSYAIHDFAGDVSITIDERGAVLRKILPSSGLPLSIALPKRAFKGVAARAIDHGDGEVTVTLELHHDRPGSLHSAARRTRSLPTSPPTGAAGRKPSAFRC